MTAPASRLYAWQEFDGERWGTIAALMPGHGVPMPLVSRSPLVAEAMRAVAVGHRVESGNRVRLATYELTTTEELES